MATQVFNIVILISGRGSNLRSLIDNAKSYRIGAVLSDKPDATGLDHARYAGIPAFGFQRSQYSSLLEHKLAIYREIEKKPYDLIVLAGFMQILENEFVQKHRGKIVNIHPSLLPEYKGLNTHRRVLNAFIQSAGKKNTHGCTVHYVHSAIDSGPIIAQAPCAIEPKDSEAQLADRVLQQEHRLFPWVIDKIAIQNIQYQSGTVAIDQQTISEGRSLGFKIGVT